ncbi:hypothetical protein FGA82_28670 [Pseudomonas fluorescens]|nr:hypothetical protein FGA82_28670 [Pseudomonas fluorescens]
MSLLAMALGQLILMLTDTPLSRAGSLLQGPRQTFLSRHADSCQDYVTATELFKPANHRKRDISVKA